MTGKESWQPCTTTKPPPEPPHCPAAPADKAAAGAYSAPGQFTSDLKLVVSNAKIYNESLQHPGVGGSGGQRLRAWGAWGGFGWVGLMCFHLLCVFG